MILLNRTTQDWHSLYRKLYRKLYEAFREFLTMPGHKCLSQEAASKELENSGKFWRCWVIRKYPTWFDEALGEGRYMAQTNGRFKRGRPQFVNWFVRRKAGLRSWSEVRPVLKRD
jgi:hypothetical protein